MRAQPSRRKQLRTFGLIVGAGFGLIGAAPAIFRGQPPRAWAVALALVLAVTAVVLPAALAPVHRVWMTIGETLGWVNSRVILTVVYYGLIVPIGMVRRLRGGDAMRRRFDRDATTYRIVRAGRPASHLYRQY
jgi:hypothetical protein